MGVKRYIFCNVHGHFDATRGIQVECRTPIHHGSAQGARGSRGQAIRQRFESYPGPHRFSLARPVPVRQLRKVP